MILDTRQKLIESWQAEGIEHIEESIWSSSIQLESLPRIRKFLSFNGFKYVDISIVRPLDNFMQKIKFHTYYGEIGQCFATNHVIPIPALSNNLKLTVGLEKDFKNQECQEKTLLIINALRLIFGVPIARELMLVTNFNYNNFKEAGYSSELGYASLFDNQNLNLYADIEYSKLCVVPIDALVLLDKAFQQRFPNERFILMWVAFEAIINSLYGTDSNGNKRKKYFKEELKSEIANNEVYRLFKIRCDIFKENKFKHDRFDDENWSLYSAIQLAILNDCPQRIAFLKGYEDAILDRS